jgi:3-phosphoglycerate kinase
MNEQLTAEGKYTEEERKLLLSDVNFENIKKFSDALGVTPTAFLNDILGYMEFDCFNAGKIQSPESKKF